MHRSFKLVAVLAALFISVSSSAAAPESCPGWERVKPKIGNLKRVIGCEPAFTTQECKENSGFGTKVALAGAAAGAMAAKNIQIKAPAVCGIFKTSSFSIWESMAWAACNSQIESGARSIKSVLQASNQVRDAELGTYLTDKLAKESPELNRLGKAINNTFMGGDNLLTRLKALNEQLAPHGIVVKGLGQCSGNEEICTKLLSLSYAASPYDTKAKIAGNASRLAEFYKYDNQVNAYLSATRESNELARRVEKGLIKNEGELEDLFRRAASTIHNSTKGLLANSSNYIASVLPALGKKGMIVEAGNLTKISAEYLAKHSGALKKILPFGLAGLIGVATGASAAEVAEGFLPLGAEITSIGCESLSRYAPETEVNGVCRPASKLTPVMKDFLLTPEEEQKSLFCQSPSIEKAIDLLNSNYFPPLLELRCDGDMTYVKSDFKANRFSGEFSFHGDDLVSSQVSAENLDGFKGYNFNFDPKTGVVMNGKIVTGARTFMPIKPGSNAGYVGQAGEDFAARQVLAYAGRSCCQGASDSCQYFKVSGGNGVSSGQNIKGTR